LGLFLITKRIIWVSSICGHRPTNGKSIVSEGTKNSPDY